MPASPPGMRVPFPGSSCGNCMYYVAPAFCRNKNYIGAKYEKGKFPGDSKYIDGKTGKVVDNPFEFCCNFYDVSARNLTRAR